MLFVKFHFGFILGVLWTFSFESTDIKRRVDTFSQKVISLKMVGCNLAKALGSEGGGCEPALVNDVGPRLNLGTLEKRVVVPRIFVF
jgi:hypothetical protein